MKTKILITLTFLFCAVLLFAQDEAPTNSIGLKWGVGHIQRQDFNFSPMLHDEWSPANFGLTYNRSGKFEQQVHVKFGSYSPSISDQFSYYWDTPEETELSGSHSFTLLDLNYALGKTIYSSNNLQIALGGRSRNRLNASYYIFGINWLGSFGYYLSFGMDAWTKVRYNITNKSSLELNVALPVFSYNARSPYHSQDDWFFENTYSHKDFPTLIEYIKDGEIQSWGNAQSFDFDLAYTYAITKRFDIGASYYLSINTNQKPVKFTSVENNFYISCNYKF